jgi:hypothetical protein
VALLVAIRNLMLWCCNSSNMTGICHFDEDKHVLPVQFIASIVFSNGSTDNRVIYIEWCCMLNDVQVSGPRPCGWFNGTSFCCKFHGGFQCQESLLSLKMECRVSNFSGDLGCDFCVQGRSF